MEFYKIYKDTLESLNSAALSLWTGGKHTMRKPVEEMLNRERVVAEPVFQSMFPWETTDNENWKDYFRKVETIEMIREKGYSPYLHQSKAWKVLDNKIDGKNSIVVTSGTGSGKTECFMYPILDKINGNESAVQALFLYPLNALMNDQCDRLNELCERQGVRFAIYNRDTEERARENEPEVDGPKVLTRGAIRDEETTPQILLSNPSILEYILLRKKDQQFIERSRGKLKWIVIDEAHTYRGSAAVELKYQIARILEAFDMEIEDVHFVCTSATIGDDDLKLAEFISNLTGQDVNRIEVIGGRRVLPEITNGEIDVCINQCGLDISVESVKTLRSEINNTEGMHLREIWTLLYGQSREYKIEEALKLIDLLCGYENKNLLKLRAHFFAKSISGIYACVNPDCPHHQDSDLGFITIENSSICPHCQMPLLELVQCKHCGEFMLQGKYNETPAGKKYIKRTDRKENVDTDSEDDTSIVGRINDSVVEFIFGRNRKRHFKDIVDVAFLNENDCLSVEFLDNADYSWWQGNNDSSHCTHCGTLMGKSNAKFFRIPTRMLTKSLALPLLHATATNDAAYGKYIAFTDSRQGTAQITKELNIESERHFYRSFFARFAADQPYTPDENYVYSNLLCGTTMFKHIGVNNNDPSPYVKAIFRNAIGRRALYESSLESLGFLSIEYPQLNNVYLPNALNGTHIDATEWRNFLKIVLDYEIRMGNHIQAVGNQERKYIRLNANCTPIEEGNNGDISPWKVDVAKPSRLVLLLCAALGIRSINSLKQNRDFIQGLLNEAWIFLKDNILTKICQNDEYLNYNYRYLDCYYLDLSTLLLGQNRNYCIRRPERLWYCPMTRRLIDVTFCGYSPAMNGKIENIDLYKVETNDTYFLPAIPSNLRSEHDIEGWLNQNENVKKLKESGLWSDLHHSAYFNVNNNQYVAAEHSAQQGQTDLQRYTEEFINGHLNILNCSTTMEMGVDIGDIDFVLLTTIPPSAANYMQRAGRAGRAGQNRAAVYSICSGDNVGYKTFSEPMWAIKANIPIGKTKESRRIVQRHINSFFFRQFVIDNEIETKRLKNFFEDRDDNGQTIFDRFINFLNQCSTPGTSEYIRISSRFEKCFGDNNLFNTTEVKESINVIKDDYIEQINSLDKVFNDTINDQSLSNVQRTRRSLAISWQRDRVQRERTLNYLAEYQFIPNANMPTGLMTLECLNSDDEKEKNEIKNRITNTYNQLRNAVAIDKPRLETRLSNLKLDFDKFIKKTIKTRELRIALNEYAPGQTIVVNEQNYVSAGVVDFKLLYDTTGQYRYISRCNRCGNIRSTVAQPNIQNSRCPICGGIYRGIINDNLPFTTLYIPLGFRTAASSGVDRTESKSKNYYNIITELLPNEDVKNLEINMCRISSSDNGTILYYNKGNNNGFTICGCGHVELTTNALSAHTPIWSTDTHTLCNNTLNRKNVMLGGEFHTSFSKFVILDENNEQTTDIVLLRSLGVILCRALVEYLGIDNTDVDFDIQKGNSQGVLYIYDTNKGGCAYSSIFSNNDEAQKIFDMALEMLQEYSCDCEKYDDTVCTACLEERRTSEFVTQLSKKAVMQWLLKQKGILVDVPQNIKDVSIDAKSSYLKLQQVLKQTVSDKEVRDITIVGEIDDEMSTTAWSERNAIIGHLLKKAISNGKKVNIKLVVDKRYLSEYEFVYMLSKLRDRLTGMDANVNFVAPQDSDIHTALVYSKNGHYYRYFTNMIEVLEVSDNWGTDCDVLFYDSENIDFKNVDLPNLADLIVNTKTVFEADLSKVVSRIAINNLWATIKNNIGIPDNYMNVVNDILCGKNVNINFKDNYCLSALSCLILTHLIKSLKDEFHFEISTLKLSFGCKSVFNNIGDISYKWLNFKWNSEDSRNNYVKDLISEELNVKADITEQDAPHYRSLVITSDVGKVEIRPDHSIGGGWRISEKYMNVDRVSGSNVMYVEDGEDVVYYVIVEKL